MHRPHKAVTTYRKIKNKAEAKKLDTPGGAIKSPLVVRQIGLLVLSLGVGIVYLFDTCVLNWAEKTKRSGYLSG